MKKVYLVFFAILISTISSYGQSIYVAESIAEDGEAIGVKNMWEIDPWGKSLYVVYDNEEQIKDNILYLFIDKLIDGSFQPFDSKVLNIEQPTSRINYDFKFTDTGKFKIFVVNEGQETLSSLQLILKPKTAAGSNVSKSVNYYDGISLIFCEKILVGGTPLGIIKSGSLSRHSGTIYMKLRQYSPLNSETVQVDLWRIGNNSYDYDQYIESKKYKIDPTWYDTFFKYKFTKPGKYKIVIYNDSDSIIKTGYITITN